MNNKILKKILSELNKPQPDISYVKGMLEVLIDEEPVQTGSGSYTPNTGTVFPPKGTTITMGQPVDEGNSIDMEAMARMKNIATNAIQTD